MTYILIILLKSLLSRASGGGLYAHLLNKKGEIDEATGKDKGGVMPFNLSGLPEILFGLVSGMAYLMVTENVIISLLVAAWVYAWMETGHVFNWGESVERPRNNQRLAPVVDFLARKLGIEKFIEDGVSPSKNYCRLFMSVKGFLIGLPFGGVVLAVLWPLGYEIGRRIKKHAVCELLAGAGAGLSVVLFLVFLHGGW